MKIISTFTVLAPLFQLNYQASDLPSTTEGAIRTSTDSIASTSTLQALPPQTSPAEASNRSPGLSVGAQAAIGFLEQHHWKCPVWRRAVLDMISAQLAAVRTTHAQTTARETRIRNPGPQQALSATKRRPRSDRKPMLPIGVAAVRARLPRRVVDPGVLPMRAGQVTKRERAGGMYAVGRVGHRERHRHDLRRHQELLPALPGERGVVPVADEGEAEGGVEGRGGAVGGALLRGDRVGLGGRDAGGGGAG
ncbi:hypothetical protein Daesc_008678 [Daldinia eschscholtzii]|uniref:Uncharacterized protein n=1 Tax=Daldinia eschscholtzii TaxID=292717 RepID=A0AAX6MDS8_9PEZI